MQEIRGVDTAGDQQCQDPKTEPGAGCVCSGSHKASMAGVVWMSWGAVAVNDVKDLRWRGEVICVRTTEPTAGLYHCMWRGLLLAWKLSNAQSHCPSLVLHTLAAVWNNRRTRRKEGDQWIVCLSSSQRNWWCLGPGSSKSAGKWSDLDMCWK